MIEVLIKVFNMSISASIVALIVMLIRLTLINGTWEFSLDAEQLTESITRDLTGIKMMNRDSTG